MLFLLSGHCSRLLRLHLRSAHLWEGGRQQGVCLSVVFSWKYIHSRVFGNTCIHTQEIRVQKYDQVATLPNSHPIEKANQSSPPPPCNVTVRWICGWLRHPAGHLHKQVFTFMDKLSPSKLGFHLHFHFQKQALTLEIRISPSYEGFHLHGQIVTFTT